MEIILFQVLKKKTKKKNKESCSQCRLSTVILSQTGCDKKCHLVLIDIFLYAAESPCRVAQFESKNAKSALEWGYHIYLTLSRGFCPSRMTSNN